MLIDDAVMRSGQNYIRGGTEKGKKCGFGKKKKDNGLSFHTFGSLLECFYIGIY